MKWKKLCIWSKFISGKAWYIFGLVSSLMQISSGQDRPIISTYPGLEIHADVLFVRDAYVVDSQNWRPIIIEGNHIDVNFNDLELYGADAERSPENYHLTAIIVRNSENITLRNLRCHRFKQAIVVENSSNIKFINLQLSYHHRKPYGNQSFLIKTINDIEVPSFLTPVVEVNQSENILISNCFFQNNGYNIHCNQSKNILCTDNSFGFFSGPSLTFKECENIKITNNRFEYGFFREKLHFPMVQLNHCEGAFSCSYNVFSHFHHGIHIQNHTNRFPDSCMVFRNVFEFCSGTTIIASDTKLELEDNIFEKTETILHLGKDAFAIVKNNHFFQINQLLKVSKVLTSKYQGFRKAIPKMVLLCDNKFIQEGKFNLGPKSAFSKSSKRNSIFQDGNSRKSPKYPYFKLSSQKISPNLADSLKIHFSKELNNQYYTELNPRVGMYHFTNIQSMILSEYGPYDFKYPVILFNDKDNSLAFWGPKGNYFSARIFSMDRDSAVLGVFPDSFDDPTYLSDNFLVKAKYSGSYFRNFNADFIPNNDTFAFEIKHFAGNPTVTLIKHPTIENRMTDTIHVPFRRLFPENGLGLFVLEVDPGSSLQLNFELSNIQPHIRAIQFLSDFEHIINVRSNFSQTHSKNEESFLLPVMNENRLEIQWSIQNLNRPGMVGIRFL